MNPANPYHAQGDQAFWSRAVAGPDPIDVDPVTTPGFRIDRTDRIAPVGSCFAQHISRALSTRQFVPLVTETGPIEQGYGVYPARFGNIYTARQLLQLFQRAFGLFEPHETAWTRGGRIFDPFRPQVEPGGFASGEAMERDRAKHLVAVRRMFEVCDVLVFTLGLTEGWVSRIDGAVFPLAPGVVAEAADASIAPHEFTVQEVVADLTAVIGLARILRPDLRVLITVSPVALVATITDRHVLSATTYSKAVLRVAAETVARSVLGVDYFPSYEIITGPQSRGTYFDDDLRSVRPAGVDHVMRLFAHHYLVEDGRRQPDKPQRSSARVSHAVWQEHLAQQSILCDEEAIDR